MTSYNKMSKKAKRAIDRSQRGSWHGVNPVSRIVPSKKGYRKCERESPRIYSWEQSAAQPQAQG